MAGYTHSGLAAGHVPFPLFQWQVVVTRACPSQVVAQMDGDDDCL